MSLIDGPTPFLVDTEDGFVSDESFTAMKMRLECICKAVECVRLRDDTNDADVMALAKAMWAFVKNESA